jgi:hypothetical protein
MSCYLAVGTITKENYAVITGGLDGLLQKENVVCLLLDMEAFEGEEFKAWDADLKFGRTYPKQISKMAIVGDKKWQEGLPSLADSLIAREAKFFPAANREAAWEWLER